MKIDVPLHAEYRLIARGIDIDNAKKTIRNPSEKILQGDGRIKATKTLEDGRVLTIIYVKEKTQMIIITGYYEN